MMDWWYDHPRARWLIILVIVLIYIGVIGLPGIDKSRVDAQMANVQLELELMVGMAKIKSIGSGRIAGLQVDFESPQRLIAFLKSDYGNICEYQPADQVLKMVKVQEMAPQVALRALDSSGTLLRKSTVCVDPALGGFYNNADRVFSVDVFRRYAIKYPGMGDRTLKFQITGNDLRQKIDYLSSF